MTDLAIIVPSIRDYKINRLYDSVSNSIGSFSFKFIVCGPYDATKYIPSCTWLNSQASPNKCVQQAVNELADECNLIKWSTDDAVYFENTLNEIIEDMYNNPNNFGICKYSEEGPPGYPSGKDDIYYHAKTHGDMKQLIGIKDEYKIAPVSMYYRDDFIKLGGLDCAYEHINMSTHDLCFRAQESGMGAIFSRSVIMHCDSDNRQPEHRPLDVAHHHNDYPIFYRKYSQSSPLNPDNLVIDIQNYKNFEDTWRRFK